MAAAEKNIMRQRGSFEKREPKEFDERVIEIARVSRVAKGGRRIRFRALVVIGDHKGRVGMGIAKANEVAEAVKKATAQAKKHIINVPIINGTIPYEIFQKHGGARVMLKPAASGTSIVAGGSVRSVADIVGITDLLAKSLGSSNKINNVTATIKALGSFNEAIVDKIRAISKKKEDAEITKNDKEKESGIKEVVEKSDTDLPAEKKKVAKKVEEKEPIEKKKESTVAKKKDK